MALLLPRPVRASFFVCISNAAVRMGSVVMLITFIGGPKHCRTDKREDLVTEADVRAAIHEPAYSYKSSITTHGEIVEAIFVHVFASKEDLESRELELNKTANTASRIF